MTRTPAPALSPAEAARVAAFDAAPTPPECDPERVEAMARALWEEPATPSWRSRRVHGEAGGFYGLSHADARRLAAAAIAALPPSPAEEAVKRVEGIAKVWDGIADMWRDSAEHPAAAPRAREMARGEEFDFRERARVLRAALASPAPAPQGGGQR